MSEIPYKVKVILSQEDLQLKWCEKYCQKLWGWFTKGKDMYIGFSDLDEKLLFCLSNDY